jgi:hypothetical protein
MVRLRFSVIVWIVTVVLSTAVRTVVAQEDEQGPRAT